MGLPKAFPAQVNSCSAMYHCQIISVSAVFYPLPPSIIAFSRRNLWLSAALLALPVYLQSLVSHP